jgi:hypothetical protein
VLVNCLDMGYLLPQNSNCLIKFLNFLTLIGHCLDEFLKHLDAVPLLNISLLRCREESLRIKTVRLIEQGVADNDILILDTDNLSPMNIFVTTDANWMTAGFLETLRFLLLFLKEFVKFSLELPPVDQIHNYYQSSQSR